MKRIKINENEKRAILGLHSSKIINEETTEVKSIADIQRLLGVKDDGILGSQTLAAIKGKLGQPDKSTTTTVDGFTYEQLKGAGWTDDQLAKTKYKSLIPTTTTTTTTMKTTDTKTPEAISMEKMKVGSLTKGPTQSGLQVGVGRIGGTPEVKSGQLADKSGEKPKADDVVDSRNV